MSQRSQLRVLFLHPKTLFDSWPFPVDTLGEIIKVPSLVYPLLAATIEHLPVDIEIFDGYVAPESFRGYKQRLARADVVAITVMTPLKAVDTELTIRLIRRLNPGATIILGGNQATAFPAQWIERGADYVITREGEAAFPLLVRHLLGEGAIDDVPNLVHAGGRSAATAPPVSLEDAPFPAWHHMDLRPYDARLGARGHAATVEVSRGCVFRCDFCNINRFWGYQQRYKSVERVLEEMDRLHHLGVRQVFFADDNFGHDHEHTCALFEALIRRGSPFRMGAFIRGDTIYKHPEFATLASRAGLRLALMGIETLDRDRLKAHRKGVRARDVVQMWTEVYGACRRNDIFVLGLFLNPLDPAEAGSDPARLGVDGFVCDFHYAADIVPQKNSLLYERLTGVAPDESRAEGRAAAAAQQDIALKDMFYHDWNLPSLRFGRRIQRNSKDLVTTFDRAGRYFLSGFVSPRRLRRHFAWAHLALLAERILTTRRGDVLRYRTAKDESLPLQGRQDRILASLLNDQVVDDLVRSRFWKSPLAIRRLLR